MVRSSNPKQETTCFHPEIENSLKTWLKERSTPAFLLIGNPGIGKTTLVYRVCKDEQYWVQEFNASHTRTGSSFRDTIMPLLTSVGISKWIHQETPNGRAILLDEMDGLSQGEKGGLQELLDYLKSKRNFKDDCPLILICNVLEGRNMQQLLKYCKTCFMTMPKKEYLTSWFGNNIPAEIIAQNDIRKLVQYCQITGNTVCCDNLQKKVSPIFQSLPTANPPDNCYDLDIHIAIQAAWFTLTEHWNENEELDLETKDANLAGLLYHQNIPQYYGRIEKTVGKYYLPILKMISLSDRGDFWAFFHQCWNLLPLSYELKLKIPNHYLAQINKYSKKDIPGIENLVYTQVLTKQSALFNAWKEMNKQSNENDIPFRCMVQWATDQTNPKIYDTIGLPVVDKKNLVIPIKNKKKTKSVNSGSSDTSTATATATRKKH
jgi:DNA polymerase III delta prime subunit